jgi:hypothetical protein
MRQEIIDFLIPICERYGLSASYHANQDMYVVHYRGFPIQNFRGETFHDIPRGARARMYLPLIKRGLAHNIGERGLKDQLHINTQRGTPIYTHA